MKDHKDKYQCEWPLSLCNNAVLYTAWNSKSKYHRPSWFYTRRNSGKNSTPDPSIADTADPKIKEQARAFKTRIFHIIVHAMKEAIVNDKTTLANKLREQGHKDMALILERL